MYLENPKRITNAVATLLAPCAAAPTEQMEDAAVATALALASSVSVRPPRSALLL